MKPVLQTMSKGMDAVLRELVADLVAERPVQRREHRLRVPKRKGQQRQRAGRRDLAQGRPRHKEFQSAAAQVTKHLGVGTEPALRKNFDKKLPARFLAYCPRHLGEPPDRRAGGGLVEAQAERNRGE